MEERPPQAPARPRRTELKLLVVLVLLAAGVRAWLVCHTEVTARDGVGFMRYAWQLREQSLLEVLINNPHPPLYPLAVLGMSIPVRHFWPASDIAVMQLSAQLTSALAGVLLVVPTFYLGRALFDRRVGFWAAALFQCLPVGSRALSDALTEGIFLLLFATSVLLAFRGFRRLSLGYFVATGLCGGLAYLARPEGALTVAATILVLLALQAVPGWRRPWRRVLTCAAGVGLAAAVVGGPYAFVIGNITNKPTGRVTLTASAAPEPEHVPAEAGMRRPLTAMIWAVYSDGDLTGRGDRVLWSLQAVAGELMRGFHYLAWIPALVGLYWFRDRLRSAPGAWVLITVALVNTLLLWRVAYVVGYVADRHTLIMVLGGLYWAVAMLLVAGDWVAALARRIAARRPGLHLPNSGTAWSAILLLALAGAALPKTLEPLHTNRAGHHAAGLWLAEHATPADFIHDPFCWAEFYAGQVFREGHPPPLPPAGHRAMHYVVLGDPAHEHVRAPGLDGLTKFAKLGTQVYHWPASRPKHKAEAVTIYAVPAKE